MPRKKNREEQELAEHISSMRSHLNLYHSTLLQFLDEHKIDRVPLDDERMLIRKTIVSSRRISAELILEVVKGTVLDIRKHGGMPLALFGILKANLLNAVDKISHVADVVAVGSREAKKKPRDGPLPITGSINLTDNVRAIAAEVWDLKQQSQVVAEQGKLLKRQRLSTPSPEEPAPISVVAETAALQHEACEPIVCESPSPPEAAASSCNNSDEA